MAQSLVSREVLEGALEKQLTALQNWSDENGSIAITLGRTAGLAKELGRDDEANKLWDRLLALEPRKGSLPQDMPGLNEMYEGYKAAPQVAFDRFNSAGIYTKTENLEFSNAMGSYAFALDYVRRQDAAISEPAAAGNMLEAGAGALESAGFTSQAADMNKRSAQAYEQAQGQGTQKQDKRGRA